MKKLLVIVVLGLLSFSSLNFQSSKAGLLDIFKEPVEVCMDILVSEYDSSESFAARRCKGINKGELACMKRLMKDDRSPLDSLRRCKA
tara:strand:- start:155 stop:418 length:264 start_codon:yes stop_codon:yes gene_type:complete